MIKVQQTERAIAYFRQRQAERVVELYNLLIAFDSIFPMDSNQKELLKTVIKNYVGIKSGSPHVNRSRDGAMRQVFEMLVHNKDPKDPRWVLTMQAEGRQARTLVIRQEFGLPTVAAGLLVRMLCHRFAGENDVV